MAGKAGLVIEATQCHGGETTVLVTITFVNETNRELGAGGLRCRLVTKRGQALPMSIANFWPVPAGSKAVLVAPLAKGWSPKVFDNFAYVEFSGAVHPISGTVRMSWLGSGTIETEGPASGMAAGAVS